MHRIKITIFVLLCVITISPAVFALDTKESLDKSINDTKMQIDALDKKIAEYQNQINTTSSESNSLKNLIKELTITRDKLLLQKKQTEKKINLAGNIITSLSNDINDKQKTLEISKQALKKSLNDLNKQDQITLVESILNTENFSEASREYNSKIELNTKTKEFINKVLKVKSDLEKSKEDKEIEKNKLDTLRQKLLLEKKSVENAKSEKDKLLKETKNKEENYKKLLAENQKKRQAFEGELRDYEAKLKFILNQKLLPTEGSGVLSWPLDNIFITQLFGKTSSSKRLYTSGSHSGVDFRASIGTSVKALGTGVVEGIGNTDDFCPGASFGKWIFIRYNNGLASTFGHLSSIDAKVGQKVVAGDIVALSGNTGHSTGPHLHVTIYAGQGASVQTLPSKTCNGKTFTMPIAPTNAYLDPMLYFPNLKTNALKKDNPRD